MGLQMTRANTKTYYRSTVKQHVIPVKLWLVCVYAHTHKHRYLHQIIQTVTYSICILYGFCVWIVRQTATVKGFRPCDGFFLCTTPRFLWWTCGHLIADNPSDNMIDSILDSHFFINHMYIIYICIYRKINMCIYIYMCVCVYYIYIYIYVNDMYIIYNII